MDCLEFLRSVDGHLKILFRAHAKVARTEKEIYGSVTVKYAKEGVWQITLEAGRQCFQAHITFLGPGSKARKALSDPKKTCFVLWKEILPQDGKRMAIDLFVSVMSSCHVDNVDEEGNKKKLKDFIKNLQL